MKCLCVLNFICNIAKWGYVIDFYYFQKPSSKKKEKITPTILMAKTKRAYFCSNCGYDAPKWVGKCPSCGEWNTFKEEIIPSKEKRDTTILIEKKYKSPVPIGDVSVTAEERLNTNIHELNRVLGGGLVKGSLVLIGGEPGIGKSTLILQMMLNISVKALYVSGEESLNQLKMRADRLGNSQSEALIVSETALEQILTHIQQTEPELIVIDSIQTIHAGHIDSSPGSVSQVRECAATLLKYCKTSGVPMILIGHITKDGTIAGPKVLEHIVDTVLQFEGDQHYLYRILRPIKNRFGNTSELGIFEMRQNGLREVYNPSELLLTKHRNGLSGIAIASTIDGVRPFLIEVQALVSSAVYGTPQRSSTGFDLRRLNMLLAVLEKRVGFKLAQKDVFLNIAGGIKVNDPAIDLAVITAILSSNIDTPIGTEVCLAGEVGLSGEIRPINRIEQRIQEAEKMGFEKIIIPLSSLSFESGYKIKVVQVQRVAEAFKELFG